MEKFPFHPTVCQIILPKGYVLFQKKSPALLQK